MNTLIAVNNNDVLGAVRAFLRSLLESDAMEGILVPLETAFGAVVPALVTDPEQLEFSNPLAPVMPINSARAVSALTRRVISSDGGNIGKQRNSRLGVVLRPCEIRALIELTKLNQVAREEIVLIGVDCPGTYEVTDYLSSQQNGGFPFNTYLDAASQGEQLSRSDIDFDLRPACQMCTQPVPENIDIHLHLFGAEITQGIPITIDDEIAVDLELLQAGDTSFANWDKALEQIITTRNQVRQKEFESIREQLSLDDGMVRLFAACIRCHNCMTVCPICYCKTCLFKTKEFDHQPEHYMNTARHKGATRLFGDTLLFHLTRMNHMSVSCVSCGMCTSACPADIPVGTIFSTVGAQVQAVFDYKPGRRLEEPLPLVAFQAEELEKVGETG
jgi:formate dehydrogenase subunit beta